MGAPPESVCGTFAIRSYMLKRVQQSIKEHSLLSPRQHVLVAVSGGADSVALLCVLREMSSSLGINLTAAHLNHGIRGKAADQDEACVKALTDRFKVPFIHGRSDVPRLAHRRRISLEMAAREARYAFFVRAARKVKADLVATAHTADDQAETILLRLIRGTGPRGLGGISREITIRGLKVVRPMLDVRKSEILSFLQHHRLTWREDESNRDTSFLRNRVRHEILPILEAKLNPRVQDALLRLAEIMREEDTWLDELAKDMLQQSQVTSPVPTSSMMLDIEKLRKYPVAARRRVLRLWFVSSGMPTDLINFDILDQIETLLKRERGTKEIHVAKNWKIRKQYKQLCIFPDGNPEAAKKFRAPVNVPGETLLPEAGLRIVTSIKPDLVRDRPLGAGTLPARASISYSAVGKKPLFVRTWRPGDRMKPLGLNGSKKIQDIFVDEKVPVEQRGEVPLFACRGEIIWLPGYRVARGWEVKRPAARTVQLYVERI